MQVCQATYSNVPVWVYTVKGVGVMRRQGDDWVNATHLLKVADYDKPKRTRILEKDVQTGQHEKVQGGYGKYQGTWVPIQRARELAHEFGVLDLVAPLLDYTASGTEAPQAPRVAAARRAPSDAAQSAPKRARRSATMPIPARRGPSAQSAHSAQAAQAAAASQQLPVQHSQPQPHLLHSQMHHNHDSAGSGLAMAHSQTFSQASSPLSSTSDFLSDDEAMQAQLRWPGRPVPQDHHEQQGQPNHMGMHSNYMADYSAKLLDYIIAPDKSKVPDVLLHPEPGFHINQPVDDEGHTAFHWACSMGQEKVMQALLDAGADIHALNYDGHTPLVRAIMFTNNYDLRTFPHVLELLRPIIFYTDSHGQTVLHHIAQTAASKSRSSSTRYYMEIVLAKMTELRDMAHVRSVLNQTDINGDSALHIASRNGSRKLVKVLLSYGAATDMANKSGRTAQEYIYEYEAQRQQHGLSHLQQSSSPPALLAAPNLHSGGNAEANSAGTAHSGPAAAANGHGGRRPLPNQSVYMSETAQNVIQQVSPRLSGLLEDLATTYDNDLKDKDLDIEQVRQLLGTVQAELAMVRAQIPELESKLGSQQELSRHMNEASANVQALAHHFQAVLERSQARDLAEFVQAEEMYIHDELQQELQYAEYSTDEQHELSSELVGLQHNRRVLLAEIVDLYASASSGEKMNNYRKLLSLSCGVRPDEIDGLLDGIAQALEDKE